MSEYDAPNRRLPYSLRDAIKIVQTTETDPALPEAGSFSWPDDPNERIVMLFYLSLNEYNVLGSTIDVGSDIAYGEDAVRVLWLWLRNMRVKVPICDLIDACITDNPATIAAIVAQLSINTTYNEYLNQMITNVAGNNIYPPRPTITTPEPLCNAASYVVSQLRKLFADTYSGLATLTPEEVLAGFLGLSGWRSSPLYQFIGFLQANDETGMLAAFDAASDDLICALYANELGQEPVLSWIETTYPSPSVIGDALKFSVQSTADNGKWAQWIAVGALMTGADCSCAIEEITDFVYVSSNDFTFQRPGTIEYLGAGRYRATTWTGDGDNSFVILRGGYPTPLLPFNVSGATVTSSGGAPSGGSLSPSNPTQTLYAAWPSGSGPQTVEFTATT